MNDDSTAGKWAVILCGGRGSRLGAITDEVPKPLVKVHGKPILWYIFMTLYKHGFRNFILPIGYKGELVKNYAQKVLADSNCHLVAIDTGEDSPIARRIHAVRHVIPEGQDFLLLNSDTIFDFDIEAMYQLHKESRALVTLSSVEVVSTWGLILMKSDELVGFDRQRKVRTLRSDDLPGMLGLVNSGLAWLNKAALDQIDLLTCEDFEPNLYQKLIRMRRAAHFQIHGMWFPIDTPKDLQVINLAAEDKHAAGLRAKAVRDTLFIVAPGDSAVED